jgi:hypothetical protein
MVMIEPFIAPRRPVRIGGAALALIAVLLAGAGAQPVDQPPGQRTPAPAEPAPLAPDPNYRPGFIDAFGRFIGSGVDNLNSGIGAGLAPLGSVVDQAGQAAKGAVDAAANVARLPAARLIDGRERCLTAPNGAPDCRAAALAMCKANGFASGNSVDFQTTETCPPEILASRRPWPAGACTVENFVTRALCQ